MGSEGEPSAGRRPRQGLPPREDQKEARTFVAAIVVVVAAASCLLPFATRRINSIMLQGSYRGGSIDMRVNSVRFDDSD